MAAIPPASGITVTSRDRVGPFAAVVVALLLGILPTSVHAVPSDADRQRFVEAETALGKGEIGTVNRYLANIPDYPLRPYLQRDLLLATLDDASASRVRGYLADHGDAPYVSSLRRAWLRRLAEQGAWSDYLKDYRPNQGVEYDCYQLQALLETGQRKEAFAGVPDLWVHGRSRPDACDPVFLTWVESGQLSATLLWARIEAAFGAGEMRLVRYLRRFLSSQDRAAVDVWIQAHSEPAATLSAAKPNPKQAKAKQIVLHALRRWGRYDPAAALDAMPELQRRYDLDESELAPIARSAAVLLAARKDPEAQARLLALPNLAVDDQVFEWIARSAMAEGDWNQLLLTIDSMPESLRLTLRWRYWRARSLGTLGREAEAQAIYQALAMNRDYYGFLSASLAGLPYYLGHRPLEVDQSELQSFAESDAVRRAEELVKLERDNDARREWNYALRDAGPDELRVAASLANQWGWYSSAIFTVAKARDWNDLELRFPVAHRDAILDAARKESLEPQWVFAVLRQESAFQPDARSSAGAMGLMQLMPATARLVAKTLPKPLARLSDLYEPDVNIPIGTRYLRMSRSDLYNSAVLATAGYNAGPHRVLEWLPEDRATPADVWIETVPYHETRGYLRRVMEYSVIYQHRLDLGTDFLKEQLSPIPIRGTPS